MKNLKNVSSMLLIASLGLFGFNILLGCGSSVKKADIAKTANPTEEIAQLETGISDGYANQYDVLAAKDFNQSINYLDKAKEALRKDRKQEKVLDDIAYSKAYLERAKVNAEKRQVKAQGVLDSRKAAMTAGAKNYPEFKDKLRKLDSDLRDNAENLDKDLSLSEFSELQKGYQDLELATIQTQQIGNTRSMVRGAIDDDAKKHAPKTLKTAEFDLKNAENTILSNRHDPTAYQSSVAKANESARLLVDVLAVIQRKGSDLDEDSAIKLVRQNNEIALLKGQVGEAQSILNEQDANLGAKERELDQAHKTIGVQAALEQARTQFNADEAEVYQQGGKLLIRLKSMAFPIGRAELPSTSLELLAKVKDVADSLNPSEITVEGHTDSTGKSTTNQKLSKQRAEAVTQYFQANGFDSTKMDSIGYGFKKPIATNKSAEGRAQNRRVDIIITPGSTNL